MTGIRTAAVVCLLTGGLLAGCGDSDEGDKASLEASGAADAQLNPTSQDFGLQEEGTESAQRTFLLTVPSGAFTPQINTTGDFSQTNDCPAQVVGSPRTQCRIHVTFTPSDIGPRSGTLATGGPTASLTGIGEEALGEDGEEEAAPKLARCKKKAKSKKAKKRCRKKLKAAKRRGAKEQDEDEEEDEEEEEEEEEE